MIAAIPCLIIGFTRVEGLRSLLASLSLGLVTKIYVAIDGPRSNIDKEAQSEIRALLDDFSLRNNVQLKIWQREVNLGVAVSILSAIDWFFSNEEYGLIIEDDLLLGVGAFEYFIENLNHFRDSKEVMMISGNQFFDAPVAREWTHYPLIWGWATWREKWTELRQGLLEKPSLRDFLKLSPISGFWLGGTLRVLNGTLDTWDIPLANYMFSRKAFCKLPRENRVSNIGNDRFATHTNQNVFPLNVPTSLNQYRSSDFSTPNTKDAKKIDKALHSMVFKVKKRHILLPLSVLLFQLFKQKKNERLIDKLGKVEIPSL